MIQEQSSSGMKNTVFISSKAEETFSDSKTIQEKVNLSGVFEVVSPTVHCAISFTFLKHNSEERAMKKISNGNYDKKKCTGCYPKSKQISVFHSNLLSGHESNCLW